MQSKLTPQPRRAVNSMRLLYLLEAGLVSSSSPSQLWVSDLRGSTYTALDPASAQAVKTLKCSGCHRASSQAGLSSASGGTIYSVLCAQAFLDHHILLQAFSVKTGRASAVKLPTFKTFGSGFAMGQWGVEYDSAASRVLVLGPTANRPAPGKGTPHALVAVYSNGTVTPIAENIAGLVQTASGSSTAYDPDAQIFYTVTMGSAVSLSVRGISTVSGKTAVDIPAPSKYGVYTINLVGHSLYCLGLAFDAAKGRQFRTLVRISGLPGPAARGAAAELVGGDSRSASNVTVTTLLNLTDYGMNLPTTAVDATARVLNTVLIPQQSQSAALVSIDLNNLTVITQPQLCEQYLDCPHVLQWANSAS